MLGIVITVVVTLLAVPTIIFLLLLLLSYRSDRIHKSKSLEAAPYHESGHAIIAMMTGMGFYEISVKENHENYGHMSYQDVNYRTTRNTLKEEVLDLSPRQELENRLMVAMAGYVAEMIYCKLEQFPVKPVLNSDMQVIDTLLRANKFLYKELEISITDYYLTMLGRTRKALEQESAAHLKLVEALKEQQVLSEFEAWNLVSNELTEFPMNPYLEVEPVSSF